MAKLTPIEPVHVAAYLRAAGWRQSQSFCEDKASLWFSPDKKEDVDVLLPRRTTAGDYQLRMDALLRDVAHIEGRTANEVLQDLALVNADVLHLRLPGVEGDDSSVPFRSSIRLLRSLEDIFAAAALAAIGRRAVFTNRKVEKVTDYLTHLRFGHTERSSFVFTVVSELPAPAVDGASANDPAQRDLYGGQAEEPFERQVTHTLMQALGATKRAAASARHGEALRAFQGAVKDGVSANLCDAIVALTDVSPTREIELAMRWAATYAKPEGLPDKIVFQKKNIQIIEEAGDAFWGISKDHDTRLEGVVAAVETHSSESGVAAIVIGYVDGRARRIRAAFGDEYLAELIRAYEERLLIRCEGDLVRQHGQYVLKNARYFELIDSVKR